MLRDARSLPGGEVIEADVCIVGAGPAGITIAQALESTGKRVVLLESGDLEHDPSTLELMGGESTGHPWYPLHEVRAAGFGGSTALWPEEDMFRARPLDEIDFESRERSSSLGGWPFGRTELQPFYDRAEPLCALSPRSYDPADWEQPPETPELAIDGTRFDSTMFKFTKDHGVFRNRSDEVAASQSTILITHAHVVRLNPGDGDAIESLDVVGLWNTAFEVRSKIFVLACGGIENARLLLLSGDGGTTSIGNQNDMVGRCFMEHLRLTSGVLVPTDQALLDRLGLYQRHFVDGWQTVAVLAPHPDLVRDEEICNGVIYLRPSDEVRASETYKSMSVLKNWALRKGKVGGSIGGHLRQVATHPGELLNAARRKTGGSSHRVVELGLQTEQAPNRDSRVTLATETDPLGFPRARVEWRLSEVDSRSIRRLQELMDRELRAARIGRVERMFGDEQPPATIKGNFHLMGTTRMHTSPRNGVVDVDAKVHGVPNLFIAGGSVFPTSGYANPTLTIVAMSLRLADHLRTRLGSTAELREQTPQPPR